MAKNASKTSKTIPVDLSHAKTPTPADVALATLLPIFAGLQDRTSENVTLGTSRSAAIVAVIKTLHETSTDYSADCVKVLGDGNKGTKKDEGTKGTLADALTAKYGNALHVAVRNELAYARIVAANWNIVAVREAAEKSGLRKARDVAKPKAAPEAAPAAPAAPVTYSQAQMVEMVANHFDDAIFAVRAYLLRCADSIGVAKLGEIEVHLANKTRKQA
jgi:hypothetical protein